MIVNACFLTSSKNVSNFLWQRAEDELRSLTEERSCSVALLVIQQQIRLYCQAAAEQLRYNVTIYVAFLTQILCILLLAYHCEDITLLWNIVVINFVSCNVT